ALRLCWSRRGEHARIIHPLLVLFRLCRGTYNHHHICKPKATHFSYTRLCIITAVCCAVVPDISGAITKRCNRLVELVHAAIRLDLRPRYNAGLLWRSRSRATLLYRAHSTLAVWSPHLVSGPSR